MLSLRILSSYQTKFLLKQKQICSIQINRSKTDTTLPSTPRPSGCIKTRKETYYLDTNNDPIDFDNPNRKVPIFARFTRPISEGSLYSLEEASVKVGSRAVDSRKYPSIFNEWRDQKYAVRGIDNIDSHVYNFPLHTDFLIIGSGLVGSAVAYYIKKHVDRCADVCVIDKEPYSTHNVTSQCNGLLSFQSKNRDHIRMSALSKELIRNLLQDPLVTPEDIENLNMRPTTHLVLWASSDVDQVMEAAELQDIDGCQMDIKMPSELEAMYPWLNVCNSDIVLGTHGNQDEFIIDPIKLRNLYRILGQAYGANYIEAEALEFNTIYSIHDMVSPTNTSCDSTVYRLPTGEIKHCEHAHIFFSMGHQTPYFERTAMMDQELRDQAKDLSYLQPKPRVSFSFRSEDCPLLNFPAITDTNGSLLIREDDFCGTFRYDLSFKESEELFMKDQIAFFDSQINHPFPNLVHKSELFKNYFDSIIKPRLVKRIPAMADANFIIARSGFASVNEHDNFPLISLHPYFVGVGLCGGFGSRLLCYGPAAAKSMAEIFVLGQEETYDISNYSWNRMVKGRKMDEFACLTA